MTDILPFPDGGKQKRAQADRYSRLLELLDEWLSLPADANEAEEWEQLRAAIEDHRLSYRRRFSDD